MTRECKRNNSDHNEQRNTNQNECVKEQRIRKSRKQNEQTRNNGMNTGNMKQPARSVYIGSGTWQRW